MSLLTDIEAHLGAAGLLDQGWEVKHGVMPPSPDRVIALFPAAGGPAPARRLGIDAPGLQIRVRGGVHDYEATLAKATAIERLLHEARGLIGSTVYPWVLSQHVPTPLGYDEQKRPEFVCNFQLVREAA